MTELLQQLEHKITQHHNLYRFPLKAELWEDIFDQTINSFNSEWEGGGHSVGADVVSENNSLFSKGSRLQLKSGDYNPKNNTVKWNGHRTTKHKTIEDKIDFISQNHYDYYVMLMRNKKDWKQGNKIYYLLMFESSKIDYSSLTWTEKYSKQNNITGWKGVGINQPYSGEINISMSHQLWTTCDVNYLGTPYKIEVKNETI